MGSNQRKRHANFVQTVALLFGFLLIAGGVAYEYERQDTTGELSEHATIVFENGPAGSSPVGSPGTELEFAL